jgi:hypothetical protein
MTIRFRNKNGFNKALRRFGDKVMPERALQLQQVISFDLLRRIVFKTPVDTGRARGNWQTSTSGSNDSEVTGVGLDPISIAGPIIAGALPYGQITLFNNVKYIRRLEDGSSQQAPLGMVKVSIAETNSQFG